jgi:hypothetical protein
MIKNKVDNSTEALKSVVSSNWVLWDKANKAKVIGDKIKHLTELRKTIQNQIRNKFSGEGYERARIALAARGIQTCDVILSLEKHLKDKQKAIVHYSISYFHFIIFEDDNPKVAVEHLEPGLEHFNKYLEICTYTKTRHKKTRLHTLGYIVDILARWNKSKEREDKEAYDKGQSILYKETMRGSSGGLVHF